ncbi:MAG: electron transfer flavoprotein subunit alpha/FixB family protein [Dehalococcoidia bacterium]
MAGILVIAETADGALAPISGELLGAARGLSDAGGGDVSAFVAGDRLGDALISLGANKVFAGTSPALSDGVAAVLLPAVNAAIEQSGANIVLMGQTSLGRDLGPALAFAHKTAVAMDCVDLKIDGGKLRVTRSAYGGNARAEHTFKGDLQIATVKAKQYDALAPDSGRSGSTVTIDVAGESPVKVTGHTQPEVTGIRIEDAPVVVSGGRGLGDASGFEMLEELSKLLKGATGASRAACDLGWYPPAQQVGLTGKTVSPSLYIAVAISGASQHMAGMAGAKNIVAINKDPDCNMVQVSKYAVIEDYKKIVPALIEAIKALP